MTNDTPTPTGTAQAAILSEADIANIRANAHIAESNLRSMTVMPHVILLAMDHIVALTDALAERDAALAAAEKRLGTYEGHLKKITITMQRDELTLEQEELRDELFMDMLEAFWTTDIGSAWLDSLEAAKEPT